MTDHALEEIGFRRLLDAAPEAMVIVDRLGGVVALNQGAERLLGWTEVELLGTPANELFPARFQRVHDAHRVRDEESPGAQPRAAPVSLFVRRRSGGEFPAEISWSLLGPGDDAPSLVTIRDLTERRRAQESLFREKEQAVVTLESIGDAVITTDAAGVVRYLNPVAERLTGWRSLEAVGQPLDTILNLISETTREPVEATVPRCLNEGRAVDLADGVVLLRRDGTEVAVGDSAAPIHDRNGATTGVVLVFHDVTERRRVSRKLSHAATHDALTGLVSRDEFERRLTRVLADAADAVDPAEQVLCCLDLDRFKLVNDSCGHEAGDALLQRISHLLNSRMRKRDTLARLGGDEFGLLLEHCALAQAEKIAEDLRRAIEELRFEWENQTFSLGVSIGLIPITPASGRAATVLRAADFACYTAKDAGGNRIHVERPAATAEAQPQAANRRVTRLSRAVDEGHFELYAQPIVPLAPEQGGRPRCEILLRLPDGRGGLETAASFTPQAERYNLMPAIDRWVVRRTIALLGQWHRAHAECELPLCSINLSASSLDDEHLVSSLSEALSRDGLPPEALCFEITEAVALRHFAQTTRLVSQIRAVGCGVALEDFGNSLTSFAYLKALPMDFLKIGGHYVQAVVADPVYGTLVGAVSEIGRIMGIPTIAEEVDDETILPKLRDLQVRYAQGHALAPPEPLVNSEGEVTVPCFRRSA
jgi:diguanylate cyclase (GGDEF)-like protein/PAS domain S-box-containing protein